jgi:TetR/AcrR family transcriptional repressor of nem operon
MFAKTYQLVSFMSKALNTRYNILQQAFALVYKQGYQATSIDDIIATTKVTKGAFFYHFKSKDEMGLAMINEVMNPGMVEVLIDPLLFARGSVNEIYDMMHAILLKSPFFEVKYGCPAVNLIEEMSPVNEQFNKALLKLFKQWQDAIQTTITTAVELGKVKKDVEAQQVAYFIMAGYSGIRNMGKMLGIACYKSYLKELKIYLDHLQ